MAVKPTTRVRWYPRRECSDCGGMGWVATGAGRHAPVRRCHCWRCIMLGRPAAAIPDGKLAAAGGENA